MPVACRIKFCGLRTPEDVGHALALGVDAVGFVLTASPRQVSPEECRALRALVPPAVRVHGVFAHDDPDWIRDMVTACRLDVAQVHTPPEDREYWRRLGALSVIRAYRVKDASVLDMIREHGDETFLLDAYLPGVAGGTGTTFDWSLAREASRLGQVILAGGLTPENVADAIRVAQPWMVDVSGGIEKKKGVKDPERMTLFAAAVRAAQAG